MANIIPTAYLPDITARVAKVNRRAEKLGVAGLTLEVSEPFEHVFEYSLDGRHFTKFRATAVEVSVVGPTVSLAGWTFVAKVDHAEGGLVYSAPGHEDVAVRDFAHEANCEHCGINRDRNTTYVLQHEDGTLTQVGSTCIKDFLGHDVNLSIAFGAAGDIEDEFFGGGFTPDRPPLSHVLAVTNCVIRRDGWTPRSKTGLGATAGQVERLLFYSNVDRSERDLYVVTEEDEEIAEKAREWARGLSNASNDYLYNLSRIAQNDFVTPKSLGLAASLINAYRREVEKDVERKIEREESSPAPVTDERITVEGTVVKVSWKQGFGYYDDARKVITVRDDRGFKVWGTCPSAISQAEQGDRVRYVARLEVSDRDETFAFAKRPSKAELLQSTNA